MSETTTKLTVNFGAYPHDVEVRVDDEFLEKVQSIVLPSANVQGGLNGRGQIHIFVTHSTSAQQFRLIERVRQISWLDVTVDDLRPYESITGPCTR